MRHKTFKTRISLAFLFCIILSTSALAQDTDIVRFREG